MLLIRSENYKDSLHSSAPLASGSRPKKRRIMSEYEIAEMQSPTEDFQINSDNSDDEKNFSLYKKNLGLCGL